MKQLEQEALKNKIKKLKFVKEAINRSIEFWCPSYIDTQNIKFEDNAFKKEEVIDVVINAVINYLENKLKDR